MSSLEDNDRKLIAQFTNYLHKIIVHSSMVFERKSKNMELNLEEAEVLEDTTVFFDYSNCANYNQLQNIATNEKMFYAIKALTEKQKQVLYYSIIEELTADNIAILMNITINNVYQLKNKGIKKLKDNIGGK